MTAAGKGSSSSSRQQDRAARAVQGSTGQYRAARAVASAVNSSIVSNSDAPELYRCSCCC